jgi:predicted dehydrogenase
MMDLGAHPMYVARWIGGQPKRIVSAFNYLTKHEVEDNAVSVIEFENGCLGVVETSFMSANSPFSLELSGTEGSLFVGGPDERNVKIKSIKLDNKDWQTPAGLPPALPSPIQMWVDAILRNGNIPFGVEEGTQLTELMQHAYIASKEKRQVDIPAR